MLKKVKKLKNKQGFTLVELIIALGVFSAGIMAAFTLALAGLNISKDNYARIQAANLAREGIELVRNQRDSNWLKIDANEDCDDDTEALEFCDWNDNLDYGYYTVDLYDGLLEQDGLDADSFATLGSCSDCTIYFADNHSDLDSKEFFTMLSEDNKITNMKRLIEINNICLDNTEEEEVKMADCGDDETIGLEVISRIYWQLLDKEHQIDVKEKIYNWKRW